MKVTTLDRMPPHALKRIAELEAELERAELHCQHLAEKSDRLEDTLTDIALENVEVVNKLTALKEAVQAVIEARNHESIEAAPLYYLGDAIDALAALNQDYQRAFEERESK